MSNIVVRDLAEIKTLGKKSMAQIQGGDSQLAGPGPYPVEGDGGNGGPGPGPLPVLYSPIDVDKLREEIFARVGSIPSSPVPYPGADPLGGPY